MKTIIFDIDGTLFDTKRGIINCLNDVLRSYGHERIETKKENDYIGPPIKKSLMKFANFNEALAVEATKQYREKYIEKYIAESKPYQDLFDILYHIKRKKYRLCIATMKTRKQVDKLLELFNLVLFFDYVETAKDDGGYTKQEMLESIKSRYPEDDFLFIGDTNSDYTASLEANIPFIYAKYGYGEVSDGEYISIDNLVELLGYI